VTRIALSRHPEPRYGPDLELAAFLSRNPMPTRGCLAPSPPSHQKSRRVALPQSLERKRRSTAGLALSSGSLWEDENSLGESGTLERPFNAK
jgi:hypothetical protein